MDLGLSIGAGEVRKRGDTAACGETGVRRKGGHRQWSEEEGHPSLQLELKLSWPNGLGINHQPGSSGPPAAAATTSASTEGARVAANGPPKAAAAIADRENCDTGPSSSTSRSTAAGRVGWRCTDEDGGGGAGRKKLRLNKEQSCYLEESFKEHTTLNPKQKLAIAKKLNLRPRQVEVWFQNRRARTKLKQTEVEYEYMKRCCESLTEENRRLHREIQELRSLKAAPPPPPPQQQQLLRLHVPAATLRMCPSCERAAARGAGGRRTGGFHIPLKPRDGHPKIAFPVS